MDAAQPFRVLVVCTANVCRSPFAAAVLGRRLAALPGGDDVEVTSAGVRAMVGAPVDPAMAEHLDPAEAALLEEVGARQLDEGLVRGADLVLALAREHRRAAVSLVPARQRRVLTLRELARVSRALEAGEGRPPADGVSEALQTLLGTAAPLRGPTAPADPAEDDVDDPHRRPAQEYARAAVTVRRAVDDVVGALPLG